MGLFSSRRGSESADSAAQSRPGSLSDYGKGPVVAAIERYIAPQLAEFPANKLRQRYNTRQDGDLRLRLAGNELLTGMFLDTLDPHSYSTFVSLFGEAAIGGPSPERDQLELLQYPRFTLRRAAAPDLTADHTVDDSRLRPLLLASARNAASVKSIAAPAYSRVRDLLEELSATNWLASYSTALLDDLSSNSWVYPGPLPPRV